MRRGARAGRLDPAEPIGACHDLRTLRSEIHRPGRRRRQDRARRAPARARTPMTGATLWFGFLVLALASSVTMASLAMRLFTETTYGKVRETNKPRAIYQWIFNFLGAGVG